MQPLILGTVRQRQLISRPHDEFHWNYNLENAHSLIEGIASARCQYPHDLVVWQSWARLHIAS